MDDLDTLAYQIVTSSPFLVGMWLVTIWAFYSVLMYILEEEDNNESTD